MTSKPAKVFFDEAVHCLSTYCFYMLHVHINLYNKIVIIIIIIILITKYIYVVRYRRIMCLIVITIIRQYVSKNGASDIHKHILLYCSPLLVIRKL